MHVLPRTGGWVCMGGTTLPPNTQPKVSFRGAGFRGAGGAFASLEFKGMHIPLPPSPLAYNFVVL